jgi:glycosyltransferase involved in cell wall biosynthesis
MANKFLIVCPVYNVENYLGTLINDLKKINYCDSIFIDDFSTDTSLTILLNNGVLYKKLVKHSGKASALKEGFKYALEKDYEAVITMDSDGQHDIIDLPNFIEKYESNNANYIVGSREFSVLKMPFARIVSNTISSLIISKLARKKIKDSQCGYRLINNKYLNIETSFEGFQFESEHLVKSIWAGANFINIPIKTIYNGSKSSMKYFIDTWTFIKLFKYLIVEKNKTL